eukprot:scaffold40606_cov45-Tisochrysis_lutea.AAC.3
MAEGAESETGGISLMALSYEQLLQLKKSLEEVQRKKPCRCSPAQLRTELRTDHGISYPFGQT